MMTLENLRRNYENLGTTEIIDTLYEIAYDYDVEYLLQDIVSEDLIDELTKSALESRGWQGVAIFLNGISYLNDDYYIINGYGNLEQITSDYLDCLIENFDSEIEEKNNY